MVVSSDINHTKPALSVVAGKSSDNWLHAGMDSCSKNCIFHRCIVPFSQKKKPILIAKKTTTKFSSTMWMHLLCRKYGKTQSTGYDAADGTKDSCNRQYHIRWRCRKIYQ